MSLRADQSNTFNTSRLSSSRLVVGRKCTQSGGWLKQIRAFFLRSKFMGEPVPEITETGAGSDLRVVFFFNWLDGRFVWQQQQQQSNHPTNSPSCNPGNILPPPSPPVWLPPSYPFIDNTFQPSRISLLWTFYDGSNLWITYLTNQG